MFWLMLLGFSFYCNLLLLLSIVLPCVFCVPLVHFPLSTTSSATSSFVASGCSDGQFSVFGVIERFSAGHCSHKRVGVARASAADLAQT